MISLWGSQRGALVSDLTASLPPLWTFARASSGTQVQSGVLSTVGNNVARFETSPAGYLNEPQATNLYFPSVNWVPNATASSSVDGAVQNAATAPDGTTTAEKLIPGSFSGVHQFYRSFAGAINTIYEASVYAKAAGWNYVYLTLGNTSFPADQSVQFDLSNGTILSQSANSTGAIEQLGNGWYRLSVQNTSLGVAGNYVVSILPQPNTVYSPVQTGDAVSGTLVWGEQAQANSFPTSYIATTTAAATQAADNLTLDLTQLPNLQTPTGYGVALEFSIINNNQPSVVFFGASIDTDANNTWYLRNSTINDNTARATSWVAGTANSSVYLPLRAAQLTNRAAFSVTPAGIRWVLNGSAVTNLNMAGQPVMTNMVVGRMPWNTLHVAAMHATTVTLIPGPQSDAWLSEMAY